MSEKTWLQSSNMLTDGYGTVYYARTVKDARRLWEILVSQTYGLNALTSERDEAVRVAGDNFDAYVDAYQKLATAIAGLRSIVHQSEVYPPCKGELDSPAWYTIPENGFCDCKYSDRDDVIWHAKREAWFELTEVARATLDSLTASTGESSEPQKEIRE